MKDSPCHPYSDAKFTFEKGNDDLEDEYDEIT